MSKITGHHCPSLGHGALGHPFGARPGDGDQRQMPGGQAGNHAAHEGHPLMGSAHVRRAIVVWVQCELWGGRRQGPWWSNPQLQNLALGTWNVPSLAGKEPMLVRKVKTFQLEKVGLTSTHTPWALESVLLNGLGSLPL